MSSQELHIVTGAFGYSGAHIAQKLLKQGIAVKTLTAHPDRPSALQGQIEAAPFDFDDPDALTRTLTGARVLYNTYWVRFDHGDSTHHKAVRNTKTLFESAKRAGVERVVHVSITKPSLDSPLPYFKGKAELEQTLEESGLSYEILRPTVLFGGRDVLINNIAWILRRFPFFGVAGNGSYRLQPIYADDLANLAIEGGQSRENRTRDAVGPEVFTFDELVRAVAEAIGVRARLVHMPRWMVLAASRALGLFVKDIILTGDEIDGLSSNLLLSDDAPTGRVVLTDWMRTHNAELGASYANELARHFQPPNSVLTAQH